MRRCSFLAVFLIFSFNLLANDLKQTVKGRIIDKESHMPIQFATVTISNETYRDGTISDINGEFKVEQVPVGRKTIQVSFVGYETVTISNLEVTMGKELVLNVGMVESAISLDEVQVKAFNNKEKPINSFAPISARTFSVEESQRYAGSMNDVSRMAMNFAGVKLTAETTNEIVIRGNSPASVLFRLEGVDIPNPSHFGDGSNTGGPMSMLNNNVLANSDFLTGAFPAEYGNTIAGVFDLRLRNGNSDKHEFMVQTALMGFELGAEGPLPNIKNGSYVVNYRYSNLSILKVLGMSDMGTASTKYDDLTFKLNFPSTKIGNISVFGLGGRSYMKMYDSERDTTEEKLQMAYESDYEMDMLYDNYTGIIGISHSYILKNSAYTKFTLAATNITNGFKWDSLSTVDRSKMLQYFCDFSRTKYMARFYINKKFDSRNTLRAGLTAEIQTFSMLDSMYDGGIGTYRILRDFSGGEIIPQAYVQYKHRFNEELTTILGVNGIMQVSGRHSSLEPRIGLNWEFIPRNTLSFGYGLHSVNAPVELVRQKILFPDGSYTEPNKELDFTKSHHLVLGYDRVFSGKVRFKSEVYYQYIYNAVVDRNPGTYSLLNKGSYSLPDVNALKNGGKGYHYGVELTAEKFMDKGMYFLSTISLYESKYRGSDGILRDNAFNSNYVFNLLAGKEFILGNGKGDNPKRRKFVLDGKINWAGGQRYTPVDLEASREAGITILDDTQAYSGQLPDYFRIDLRFGYKWMGKSSTKEIAIDIQNFTNRENPFFIKYDPESGDLVTKGFGMMPDLLFRISF